MEDAFILPSHSSLEDRIEVARRMKEEMGFDSKVEVLVDGMEDAFNKEFAASGQVLFSYRQPGGCPPRSPRWPCSRGGVGLQVGRQLEQEHLADHHLGGFPDHCPRPAASKSASLARRDRPIDLPRCCSRRCCSSSLRCCPGCSSFWEVVEVALAPALLLSRT